MRHIEVQDPSDLVDLDEQSVGVSDFAAELETHWGNRLINIDPCFAQVRFDVLDRSGRLKVQLDAPVVLVGIAGVSQRTDLRITEFEHREVAVSVEV